MPGEFFNDLGELEPFLESRKADYIIPGIDASGDVQKLLHRHSTIQTTGDNCLTDTSRMHLERLEHLRGEIDLATMDAETRGRLTTSTQLDQQKTPMLLGSPAGPSDICWQTNNSYPRPPTSLPK